MTSNKVIRHKDYELQCSARAVDSGRFAPALVVAKLVWPSRPRTIDMARGDFPSEEEAIAAAHAQGIQWVTNYG